MAGYPQIKSSDREQAPPRRGFALRVSALYAAMFGTLGVQMPFLPIWFAAVGLDARTIGFLLAAPLVVRVGAIVIAAREADRRDALRGVIIAAAVLGLIGFALLGLVEGAVAVAIVFVLASVAHTPLTPLTDAYAVRGLKLTGGSYGPLRLWGSAAFIVCSLGAGFALDSIAAPRLIWLIVGGVAATVAAAFWLLPLPAAPAPMAADASSTRRLLRSPAFLAAVGAASLIQASHAVYYGFSTIDWRSAGLGGGTIGALWALGVLAEIVLFAMAGRLPPSLGRPTTLLVIGGVGATLRWAAMALDPPAALLPALQCLHALSFGATHLGAIGFVGQIAATQIGAGAQGYLSVAIGLAMAAAMALAGVLYQAVGGTAYAAMMTMAALGVLLATIAHRRGGETAAARP